MANSDNMIGFINILNDNKYWIETLLNDCFPVSNGGISSVENQLQTLSEFKNRILLDSNPAQDDLRYFKALLDDLSTKYVRSRINNEDYFLQDVCIFYKNGYNSTGNEETQSLVKIDDLAPSLLLIVESYSKNKYLVCKQLIEQIQVKIQLLQQSTMAKKLKVNLSVADLSLFFKLLYDEKLVQVKYQADIYRFIAQSFSTSKQENISDISVKNKFLSPEYASIKNVEPLLVNMLQRLKKMKSIK